MHFYISICILVSTFQVCFCELESKDCEKSTEIVQILPGETNTTVVVNLEENKIYVCSQTLECQCYTSDTVIGSSVPQITPLVVHSGVLVNIITPSNRTLQFQPVTPQVFLSCAVENNESSLYFNISESLSSFPVDHLATGSNLFICTDINDSQFTCENGCRLNITVQVSECQDKQSSNVCNGNGVCGVAVNESVFTCKCFDGFGGKTCEIKYEEEAHLSVCEENNCLNGGTCVTKSSAEMSNNQSTTKCKCPPYVTGEFCETILNKCKSNPCVNGVCVEQEDGYQCFCVPGFHGKQCELEYNECLSSPCLNKGKCIDRVDKYECRCKKGYTGVTCQEKVNFCHQSPCHRNSTCKVVKDGFHCFCAHGYTGIHCEQKIRSCDSNPCRNHGTCIEFEHGHQCMCPVTFAGLHCEYMMDVFAPPMEGSDVAGESHKHNLYIVAGTLGSMVLIFVSVIIACYCKIYETYKQLMWRRLRYQRKRANSCPDLETCNEPNYIGKHRLSADAIWEATSLCHDNAAFENVNNHQTFGNTSLQI